LIFWLFEILLIIQMNSTIPGLLIVVLLMLSLHGLGQHDTVIYTGVNGRLTGPEKALIRKEIDYRAHRKIEIHTSRQTDKNWQKLYTEQITVQNSLTFHILNKDADNKSVTDRIYKKQPNGTFEFSEYSDGKLIKTAHSLYKLPVVLQGEQTEFYPNGQIKSKSFFDRNELQYNLNWFENGDRYIDSVFYSVDEEPTLLGGNALIHEHVMKVLKQSGLDYSTVNGNLLLGFVVMETGKMEGIRILNGLNPQLNEVAVKALATYDRIWKPGRLNGKPVRYFHLFPINFISRETNFQYMEFDGYMLKYDKY
jgi:hypothetical protein